MIFVRTDTKRWLSEGESTTPQPWHCRCVRDLFEEQITWLKVDWPAEAPVSRKHRSKWPNVTRSKGLHRSWTPWLLDSLAPWPLGSSTQSLLAYVAPWLLVSLAPWLLGSLTPWFLDSLAPWFLDTLSCSWCHFLWLPLISISQGFCHNSSCFAQFPFITTCDD